MDWNELRNQLIAACDNTKTDLESIQDPSAPFSEDQAVAFFKGLCCLLTDPSKDRSTFREQFIAACDNTKTDLESIQDPSASLTDFTEAQQAAFFKGLYLMTKIEPSVAVLAIKMSGA